MKASRLQVSPISSPFAPLPTVPLCLYHLYHLYHLSHRVALISHHVGLLLQFGLDVVDEHNSNDNNTGRCVFGYV